MTDYQINVVVILCDINFKLIINRLYQRKRMPEDITDEDNVGGTQQSRRGQSFEVAGNWMEKTAKNKH